RQPPKGFCRLPACFGSPPETAAALRSRGPGLLRSSLESTGRRCPSPRPPRPRFDLRRSCRSPVPGRACPQRSVSGREYPVDAGPGWPYTDYRTILYFGRLSLGTRPGPVSVVAISAGTRTPASATPLLPARRTGWALVGVTPSEGLLIAWRRTSRGSACDRRLPACCRAAFTDSWREQPIAPSICVIGPKRRWRT